MAMLGAASALGWAHCAPLTAALAGTTAPRFIATARAF